MGSMTRIFEVSGYRVLGFCVLDLPMACMPGFEWLVVLGFCVPNAVGLGLRVYCLGSGFGVGQ